MRELNPIQTLSCKESFVVLPIHFVHTIAYIYADLKNKQLVVCIDVLYFIMYVICITKLNSKKKIITKLNYFSTATYVVGEDVGVIIPNLF